MFGFTSSAMVAATLWVLAAFSLVAWTLIVRKGWLQWRLSRQNRRFQQAFWRAASRWEAEALATASSAPLAALCRAGFAALRDMEEASAPMPRGDRQDVLERGLRQQIQKLQRQWESGLAVLASIGSTAPFVGLFGTVWGIMHALQSIGHSGSAGLDVVAGPIGEALIATALGIATAIPAVLAYNAGVRRLRLSVGEIDSFATDFLRWAMKLGFQAQSE